LLSNAYQLSPYIQQIVLNVTFNNAKNVFQLYRQFYLRRKPEYPEKTTDLPRVID